MVGCRLKLDRLPFFTAALGEFTVALARRFSPNVSLCCSPLLDLGHFGGQRLRNRNFGMLRRMARFKVIVPIRTQSGRRKDTDSPPLSPSKLLTAKLLVAKAKAARRPKVKLDLGDVVSVKKAAASSNRSAVKYVRSSPNTLPPSLFYLVSVNILTTVIYLLFLQSLVVPFGRAFCYPFLSLSLLFLCLSDIRCILDLKYCPIPACFDTVLANEGDGGIMGVDGYRVAQVRVVTLTSQATSVLFPAGPVKPPTHLAYVE
ncbi:hypothetical protein F4604DRAFT_1943094 [Suillus subluteus]|nr:hypothetical protein F4604DRAFT_1943094 [Suillus subluteus]